MAFGDGLFAVQCDTPDARHTLVEAASRRGGQFRDSLFAKIVCQGTCNHIKSNFVACRKLFALERRGEEHKKHQIENPPGPGERVCASQARKFVGNYRHGGKSQPVDLGYHLLGLCFGHVALARRAIQGAVLFHVAQDQIETKRVVPMLPGKDGLQLQGFLQGVPRFVCRKITRQHLAGATLKGNFGEEKVNFLADEGE